MKQTSLHLNRQQKHQDHPRTICTRSFCKMEIGVEKAIDFTDFSAKTTKY